jgi:hypothetical protein
MITEPLWYRGLDPKAIPVDSKPWFLMRAEAIVIDATFLEDATSTKVGLPPSCGIICCRSVDDKPSAKRLAKHESG